jgi:ribonucleotide reductase beta subunit family protein with ferritin-like domain
MPISLVEKDHNIKEFTRKQMSIFWLPDEPKVEKDIQDIRVNLTEAEKHGVITVLKLFSLYEMSAGDDYWAGRFRLTCPEQIEYIEMASVFSMVELAIHLQFYKKLNELLYLDTDEFYTSYTKDTVLTERMDFIGKMVGHENDLVSLGAFSMIEGAILYSSFAFLKHFQSQGKNKLLNIVRGINFSVRDEELHSQAGAYEFRRRYDLVTTEEKEHISEELERVASAILLHESRIIDMIFEKGDIDGLDKNDMKVFVQSRLIICLAQLGLKTAFPNINVINPIADWFYDGINGFQFNDIFSGLGASYSRDWSESEFTWETK